VTWRGLSGARRWVENGHDERSNHSAVATYRKPQRRILSPTAIVSSDERTVTQFVISSLDLVTRSRNAVSLGGIADLSILTT
jgi:hypothetical protein